MDLQRFEGWPERLDVVKSTEELDYVQKYRYKIDTSKNKAVNIYLVTAMISLMGTTERLNSRLP